MIISNISLDCCCKLKTLVVLSNGKVKWFKLKVMDIHHVCHIHSYKHHYDIASKVMTKLTEWLLTYQEMSAIFCFCLGSANLFEIMISTQIRYKWEYIGVLFLAATKQLYEWYFLSVCPSVRLSVRLSVCPSVTPFWLCSHHRIIMKFSGVITLDQGKVHAEGQGQRSKVKVTEVTTQIFVSGL